MHPLLFSFYELTPAPLSLSLKLTAPFWERGLKRANKTVIFSSIFSPTTNHSMSVNPHCYHYYFALKLSPTMSFQCHTIALVLSLYFYIFIFSLSCLYRRDCTWGNGHSVGKMLFVLSSQ